MPADTKSGPHGESLASKHRKGLDHGGVISMIRKESSASRATIGPKTRLAKLEEKHRHELLDYEQRCALWSRIAAARAEIAREARTSG